MKNSQPSAPAPAPEEATCRLSLLAFSRKHLCRCCGASHCCLVFSLGHNLAGRWGWLSPTPPQRRSRVPAPARLSEAVRPAPVGATPALPASDSVSAFFFFLVFLGPYLWHMEVPRLGIKSKLQLPDYTTATATRDPNRICDLYHSSRQCWIPDLLSGARDRTRVLMNTSRVCYC